MKTADAKVIIERVVGRLEAWEDNRASVRFRCGHAVTLKLLTELSEALGTDAINFDFGTEGEPGYSSVTPGSDGTPGWIEIILPPGPPKANKTPKPPREGDNRLLLDLADDES
jgi:hypothetical protein